MSVWLAFLQSKRKQKGKDIIHMEVGTSRLVPGSIAMAEKEALVGTRLTRETNLSSVMLELSECGRNEKL